MYVLALPLNEGEVVLVPPICKSQLSRLLLCTRHVFLSLCFGRKLCVCVAQKLRWFVCKINSKDSSVMSRDSRHMLQLSRVRVTSLFHNSKQQRVALWEVWCITVHACERCCVKTTLFKTTFPSKRDSAPAGRGVTPLSLVSIERTVLY